MLASVTSQDPQQTATSVEPGPLSSKSCSAVLPASDDEPVAGGLAHVSSSYALPLHATKPSIDKDDPSGSPLLFSEDTSYTSSTPESLSQKATESNLAWLRANLRRTMLTYCIFLAQEIPTHLLLSAVLALLGGLMTEMFCAGDSSGTLSLVLCPNRASLHHQFVELGRSVVSLEKTLRTGMQCDSPIINKAGHQTRNFANLDDGALPIVELTSPTYQTSSRPDIQFWRRRINRTQQANHPPSTVLKDIVTAGSCWPMGGSAGRLGVRLARDILIQNFTLTHVRTTPPSVLLSAPKDLVLWGVVKLPDHLRPVVYERVISRSPFPPLPLPKEYLSSSWDAVPLGTFTYDIHHEDLTQSFVVDPILDKFNTQVSIVVLEVVSNWGSPHFTCLYNFGVYGSAL